MTQTICFKNKFGYCRYSEKRHPKICKYYRDFRRCKFTVGCKYKHENQNELFEEIKKKIEYLEHNMVESAKLHMLKD